MYQLLIKLWQHIQKKRRLQILLVIALMLFSSLAEVLSLGSVIPFLTALSSPEKILEYGIISNIVKRLGIESPTHLLPTFTTFFVIAAIIAGGLRTFLLWAQIKVSHAIGSDISIDMYRRTLFQSYSVHISRNSASIISGISQKAGGVVGGTIMPLMTIVNSIFVLFALFLTLIYLDSKVALGCLGIFGFIYAVIIFTTKRMLLEEGRHISEESNRVIKLLQEGLGNIRDILIEGNQEKYADIYGRSDLKLRTARARVQFISGSPKFAMETLGMVFIALLAFLLTVRAGGVNSAIPILGAMALGAQRMLPLFQQIYASWSSIRGGQASLSDSIELLEQAIPNLEDITTNPLKFEHSIHINDVEYHYPNCRVPVLKRVNFFINKGTRTGIVGETGGGKSTLLDIVMGLLLPTEGKLLVDGVVIDKTNSHAWQKNIAHVPQSIYISDATIAENIAFGLSFDEIDMVRVQDAAEKARLSDVINNWPNGYQTNVGEQGVRLSGGQRQRLAIARALYKKASILVFDEATSSLDNNTELAVMESIQSLGHDLTIILVAHRLTTLRCCEQVISLSSGTIDFFGTYDEVIRRVE